MIYTVAEGAKGSDVVLAVFRRIEASGIFPNDNKFLRRIAYVESYTSRTRTVSRRNNGKWTN